MLLFFIISITRRRITFKRHIKRWLFNICFLNEGGSILIKKDGRNRNCMRELFITNNFIRECRVQDILRERIWGYVGFAPCFILYFLHTKSFVQIVPKLKWIFSGIYEMMSIWIRYQTHNSISFITIIFPINLLFIRLRFAQCTNGDIKETLPLQVCTHIGFK